MKAIPVVCKIKPYIQPFEKTLALGELRNLAGAEPTPLRSTHEETAWAVRTSKPPGILVGRLTYWESVRSPEKEEYTSQAIAEATVNSVRNGIPLEQIQREFPFQSVVLPNRRVLRYGPHGIHEYRGKFFPQLVRGLLNIAGTRKGSLVADPMCGSGTTLVEAVRLGCDAVGLDMNPLSVFISKTKCDALEIDPDVLKQEYHTLREYLLKYKPRNGARKTRWLLRLSVADQDYLRRWFSPTVLGDLDFIIGRIQEISDVRCRNLFLVGFSNILRRVSWQKTDDLRVRKELRPDEDLDCVAEFLAEIGRTVRILFAYNVKDHSRLAAPIRVEHGDARQAGALWADLRGKVDAVVTSPPYATALPYIDTDRLSLCFLGLLARKEHRRIDVMMIGNREVTESQRRQYRDVLQERQADLPGSVMDLIQRIETQNGRKEVGFRRRNLPALLGKYFLDMKATFENIRDALRKNASLFLVIGNSHTVAGGQRVDIQTDKMLAEIGRGVGLDLEQALPMDMLVSRDIFRNNSVAKEFILHFRK